MTRTFLTVLLVTALELPATPSEPTAVGAPSQPTPFEFYNNHIYLPVEVNGHLRRFILDSGASVSIISERCARELGLSLSASHELENAGNGNNATRISYIKDVSVTLSGVQFLSGKALAVSLDAYENQEGRSVDGVIGFELFKKRVVAIDYANRTLVLSNPETYTYSGRGSEIPLRIAGWAYVRAKLTYQNQEPLDVELSIDTGSQAVLQLNRPFTERHPLLTNQKTIDDIGTGVGGEYARKIGRLTSVRIGDIILERPVTSFSQAVKGASTSAKFDGTIGSELLRRFSVVFDYSHKRLILERSAYSDAPFEADMSGVLLSSNSSDSSSIKIRRVFANSPAASAGLLEGDIVVEVNGKRAVDIGLSELRRMLKVEGQTVSMKIQRGDQLFERSITTARQI
jgi:hypothetical protein